MRVSIFDLLLGVVLGATGALTGFQVIQFIKTKRKQKKAAILDTPIKSNIPKPTIYQSPEPVIYNDERAQIDNGITEGENGIVHIECNENNKKESENVLNLLYMIGEAQAKQQYVVHRGISCNICNTNPLTGVRFKCVNCVDYDVCAACETTCKHDITHVFVKIVVPIPPLANPRTTLLKSFYPGNKSVSRDLPWEEVLYLRDNTYFEETQIEVLHEQFQSLCAHEKGISKSVFQVCLGPLTSKRNLVVDQLFQFYDHDRDGSINFHDFVHGMSIMTKGSKAEKIKYVFQGYDVDNDGFISKDDLHEIFKAYHQLSMELVRDVVRSCEEEMMATYDDSGSRPISSVFNAPIPDGGLSSTTSITESKMIKSERTITSHNNHDESFVLQKKPHDRSSAVEAMTQDAILELVDQIMLSADTNKDGLLSEEEFYQYVIIDLSLLAWFDSIDTVF